MYFYLFRTIHRVTFRFGEFTGFLQYVKNALYSNSKNDESTTNQINLEVSLGESSTKRSSTKRKMNIGNNKNPSDQSFDLILDISSDGYVSSNDEQWSKRKEKLLEKQKPAANGNKKQKKSEKIC